MDAAQYMQDAMRLILAASPFLLVSMSLFYASDLIQLIRKAVVSSRKDW